MNYRRNWLRRESVNDLLYGSATRWGDCWLRRCWFKVRHLDRNKSNIVLFLSLFFSIPLFVTEWKSGDKNGMCRNTRGIIFYSTPHRGSRVAALKQTTQMFVWPSIEVQELREGSESSDLYRNKCLRSGNYDVQISYRVAASSGTAQRFSKNVGRTFDGYNQLQRD